MNLSTQESNVKGWDHSERVSTTIGMIIDLELTENFSLVLEPMYTGKGSSIKDTREESLVYEFEHKYLDIPVLFRYSMGKTIRPFVQAGPYLGILTSSKLGGQYEANPLSADMKRITAGIDVGLSMGAGLEYDLGKVSLNFQASYELGLLNTLQPGTININVGEYVSKGTIMGTDVCKNRSLQLLVGVTMPL
jgi:hypothetical protein